MTSAKKILFKNIQNIDMYERYWQVQLKRRFVPES